MVEATLDQVGKHVGAKLVVRTVVFVVEERGNFSGDDDLGFTVQIAQVVEEYRPHIVRILAGNSIATAKQARRLNLASGETQHIGGVRAGGLEADGVMYHERAGDGVGGRGHGAEERVLNGVIGEASSELADGATGNSLMRVATASSPKLRAYAKARPKGSRSGRRSTVMLQSALGEPHGLDSP